MRKGQVRNGWYNLFDILISNTFYVIFVFSIKIVLLQAKSEHAKAAQRENKLPHRLGSSGYLGLSKRIGQANITVLNRSTKEEVDLSGMNQRTIDFMVGRSRRLPDGRYEVDTATLQELVDRAVRTLTFYFNLVRCYSYS